MLKTLVAGESSGTQLAENLRLPYSVLDALIQHARVEKLVEVRGTSGTGSAGYRYVLTDLGRDRAMQFLDISRYVGPAPVPLAQYNAYVRACMAARPWIDRDRLSRGFENLIVNQAMYDKLGPAVNSGKSLFLYGAPGNGKTVVAEGIGRALGTDMHIPYAIDVDGQTITMFDPVSHVRTGASPASQSVIAAAAHDRRWEQIRRPVVVVGGELTLEMLDLTFNPIAKFYEAPIQMKANGGVFVVDDFGRQRIPPRDLLNRWIVPLESRVDFLTLHTGRKFEIPFNVFIIFATNLKPESLADEAFLRRIPTRSGRRTRRWRNTARSSSWTAASAALPVRRGDGRVPEPRLLPAAQDPDARLPSARPDRAGHRHVPLPEPRAGDHARHARRRLRQLLPRGERIAEQGTRGLTMSLALTRTEAAYRAPRRPTRRRPPRLQASSPSKVFILTLFSSMAMRMAQDFRRDRPRDRPAAARQRSARRGADARAPHRRPSSIAAGARLLTMLATFGPPLVRPRRRRVAPESLTSRSPSIGLIIVVLGKLSLGRSFGLTPANRGVVSTGLYRKFVRHPIYLGYLITHLGFVIANPADWNLVRARRRRRGADAARDLRGADAGAGPEYRAYMERVRWRIVPRVF